MSNQTGTSELHFHPKFSGTSSLESDWRERSTSTETISTKLFDSLFRADQFSSPIAIKIDVEGHENQVISGMKTFLTQLKVPLLIQIEITHLDTSPIKSTLEQHGFQLLHTIDGVDHYFIRDACA